MSVTFFMSAERERMRRTKTPQGAHLEALIGGVWRATLPPLGRREEIPPDVAATWETRPVAIDYLMWTMPEPPLLLRQVWTATTLRQEAFRAGQWEPTRIVWDYMFGRNDFVEGISETQARDLEPAAV